MLTLAFAILTLVASVWIFHQDRSQLSFGGKLKFSNKHKYQAVYVKVFKVKF